jgi:hypothetical protein
MLAAFGTQGCVLMVILVLWCKTATCTATSNCTTLDNLLAVVDTFSELTIDIPHQRLHDCTGGPVLSVGILHDSTSTPHVSLLAPKVVEQLSVSLHSQLDTQHSYMQEPPPGHSTSSRPNGRAKVERTLPYYKLPHINPTWPHVTILLSYMAFLISLLCPVALMPMAERITALGYIFR